MEGEVTSTLPWLPAIRELSIEGRMGSYQLDYQEDGHER